MHLTSEELLDLAEGTRSESSAPHLATCHSCRQQLNELRDVMATLQVDVPEPSPLFWDHFSARVSEAVASDAKSARSWFGIGTWSWGVAAALTAVVVVVAVSRVPKTPADTTRGSASVVAEVPAADIGSTLMGDDPSFVLLRDLAGGLDWDAAAEVGIGMDVGSADTAVAELSDAERTELQRLLHEAISPTGA
ncbi:MAG TPA: hypothetical protein VF456_08640 [Vicinamibacterales bacterium]